MYVNPLAELSRMPPGEPIAAGRACRRSCRSATRRSVSYASEWTRWARRARPRRQPVRGSRPMAVALSVPGAATGAGRRRRGRVRALRRRQHRGGARARGRGHPLSFLHVTRAEIDLPPETNPYDARVYAQAVANFEELKRAAPLVLDDEPSLYLYRLRMGAHEQIGLAGCFSLDEYDARPDQEAREDAQGQGRRPHAAHRSSCARRRASCS